MLALLMSLLCVILHNMSSGKSPQLQYILPWPVCHQYDVCENYVGSVYIGRYRGLSENGLCVFLELCPVSLLVVDECSSVWL